MKVAGGCQHPDMTLVKMCSPSLLSWASWGWGREALSKAGACHSCPLRQKPSPGLSLGLLKPTSNYTLGLSPAVVLPGCTALGNGFCFWSLGFPSP